MAFLDNKVRGAHDRQRQALIAEASKAGVEVTDIIEIGDAAEAAGAAVGSSVKSLFGGRMKVDFVQVFKLHTNGWAHAFAQPFAGFSPLPGEHHGSLLGGIASPAILRNDRLFRGCSWDPAAGREVAQYLNASPLLRQATTALEWEWAIGMGKITIDWAVQVRNVGNQMSHVVMQTGRYGGLTTYAVGFQQWLRLCHAIGTCLGNVHAPPQAFVVPASYGELIDAASGVAAPPVSPAQTPQTASMSGGGVHDKINAAANLLLAGQYQASIDSYLQIAHAHPEQTGTCYGQIGAGLFFLQHYSRAIEYYEAAKQHGADPAMMDDNIAEARGYLT